jgi:hypothetical protein
MQLLEVSDEYLIKSEAYLYFYDKNPRSPKPKYQWTLDTPSSFCRSPIAESSQLERSDCENWRNDLVHSAQRQNEPDIDDCVDDWKA